MIAKISALKISISYFLMFKVNNKDAKRRSGVFIVNFE